MVDGLLNLQTLEYYFTCALPAPFLPQICIVYLVTHKNKFIINSKNPSVEYNVIKVKITFTKFNPLKAPAERKKKGFYIAFLFVIFLFCKITTMIKIKNKTQI